jgi:hypothetical protein
MKSKFKHLVVSGCSFTHDAGRGGTASWADILANDTGMTIDNLAMPGAGNDHISKSIILHLEHNKFDPADTLVMAMWSGIGRIDWITDASMSHFKSEYPFSYYYDDFNELVLGGNWWNQRRPSHVMSTLIEYSKYQSDHSMALHSWMSMNNLSNYLTVNGYQHCYTSFINYQSNNLKGDAMKIDYFKQLDILGLVLDRSHWIKLDPTDYYGDFARKINALSTDDFHPRYPEATETWTRSVLIPALTKSNILYTS